MRKCIYKYYNTRHLLLSILLLGIATCFQNCSNGNHEPDAYGNFEAVEIIVSSEGSGRIMSLNLEEGSILNEDRQVGYIDTMQLYLKKVQLQAAIKALHKKVPNASAQLDVLKEQLHTAQQEQSRFEKLVHSGAATTKQLDDIKAQVEVINRQLISMQSTLEVQTDGILAEAEPLRAQIMQVNDMISKSIIRNPTKGTVLTKFAHAGEFAAPGKPLYKVADIENIILRAYFSGEQISDVKINQAVKVFIDAPKGKYKEYEGIVTWIASKAEFSPKVIQTKDERVNLVYAVKISVKNDGGMKIGMPGEVQLTPME